MWSRGLAPQALPCHRRHTLRAGVWLLVLVCVAAAKPSGPIDTDEITVAQKAWADGIIGIGARYTAGEGYEAYHKEAVGFVDRMYAYATTDVFFKPTLAAETATHEHHEFRLTRDAAISYMVGGYKAYPEDHGFALKPWVKIEFSNAGIHSRGDMTMAMGDYYFTDPTDAITKVEYSFGYARCNDTGIPRIILHHSSLPYRPQPVPQSAPIDKDEIATAQKAWADGIIGIGARYTAGEGYDVYHSEAAGFVDKMYAYATTDVFFKPTLAAETAAHEHHEFRLTRDAAISYMVGGYKAYPEDHGFALKPWVKIEFSNAGIHSSGDMTVAMGDYYFTDPTDAITKVEYSFGYARCSVTGLPRIVLHHSSLPYKPQPAPQSAVASKPSGPIDMDEIAIAQKAWADGIIGIGDRYTADEGYGAYHSAAGWFIDQLYAYATTDVFFKPTLASETEAHEHHEFRLTRDAALSYMVGGYNAYPEDKGFALKPWVKIEFRNAGIYSRGSMTLAMGDYYFTDPTNAVTKVEYSFGYTRCNDTGFPRIVLHHSSLPYQPQPGSSLPRPPQRAKSGKSSSTYTCLALFIVAGVSLYVGVSMLADGAGKDKQGFPVDVLPGASATNGANGEFMLQTRHGRQTVIAVVTDPDNWRAGFTVALVSVSLSISIGIGSGTTPMRGLSTAIFGGICAAFFGSSDYNVVGPAGALSGMLMAYSVKWTDEIFPWICLISSVLIVLILVLRLHEYVSWVPTPVFEGFTLAVAVLIGCGQINFACGVVPAAKHELFVMNVYESVMALDGFRWTSLLLFLSTAPVLMVLGSKFPKVPWTVVVPVLSIPIGFCFHAASANDMGDGALSLWTLKTKYGELEPRLIQPLQPLPELVSSAGDLFMVVLRSAGIAVVAVLETLISAKIAATRVGRGFDETAEIRGLAMAHAVCGAAGAMPPTGVFVRTALNVNLGATHRFAQLLNAVVVAVISVILMPVFLYLPQATVAAILGVSSLKMVPASYLVQLHQTKKSSFLLCVLTAVVCVVVEPVVGLALGTILHRCSAFSKMRQGLA